MCRMGDLNAVWKDMEEGGEVHDNAWSLSPYSCSLPCVLTMNPPHTHTLTHLHTCLVLDDRLYFGRTMSLIYSEEICGMCNRSWYRAHSAIGTGSHFISYAK